MALFLSKYLKKIVFGLFIAAMILYSLARLYYYLTDDFRLANITLDVPNRTEWEVSSPTPSENTKINEILSQNFYYIGKGAQSYAFGSQDGNYVIKFFKFKHLRPSFWLDLIPPISFEWQQYKVLQYQRKNRKLEGVFNGYHLAYNAHRRDSGLIYIHLNHTESSYPPFSVFDKIGWEHSIPLDQVVFILQEYAVTAKSAISALLKNQNLEAAKYKIDQIFDLYLSEYKKGIFDNDHGVMRNVGFVGNRAIRIDVGKLKKNADMAMPRNYAKDLAITKERMLNWLSQNEAVHYEELKTYIENKVKVLIGN